MVGVEGTISRDVSEVSTNSIKACFHDVYIVENA
jgi:hypothetical protein